MLLPARWSLLPSQPRHEGKRLAWEQEQAAESRRLEQSARLLDVKRGLFTRFVALAREAEDLLNELEVAGEESGAEHAAARQRLGERWPDLINDMEVLRAELELLAPAVVPETWEVTKALLAWRHALVYDRAALAEDNGVRLYGTLTATHQAMRESLGLSE